MRKTKYHIKKKIMPLLLAVAMAGTATPIYVAHPAIVKAAVSNAFGTNKISLSAGSYTVPSSATSNVAFSPTVPAAIEFCSTLSAFFNDAGTV